MSFILYKDTLYQYYYLCYLMQKKQVCYYVRSCNGLTSFLKMLFGKVSCINASNQHIWGGNSKWEALRGRHKDIVLFFIFIKNHLIFELEGYYCNIFLLLAHCVLNSRDHVRNLKNLDSRTVTIRFFLFAKI